MGKERVRNSNAPKGRRKTAFKKRIEILAYIDIEYKETTIQQKNISSKGNQCEIEGCFDQKRIKVLFVLLKIRRNAVSFRYCYFCVRIYAFCSMRFELNLISDLI